MVRPLTESLLRALVRRAQADETRTQVLAVVATPSWTGEPVITMESGPARVVPCVSSLAVREALANRDGDSETLVILTDRDEADLGQEVLARVWRQRLVRPSGWEALEDRFDVDRLDPALADHRWLVDLLVDVAPARGYPKPPSGFLDLPTAWRTLLRHALRLDTDRPTAGDLVRWGQTDAATAALVGPAREHLDRIAQRLATDAGALAPHVLRLVAGGRGSELVPFGLVCDVLWTDEAGADAAVVAARARFEAPLGTRDLAQPTARAWADAATGLVRRAAEAGDEPLVTGWVTRAEHLLTAVGALHVAASSDVLPAAFAQRLESAGRRLGAFLDQPQAEQLPSLEEGAQTVQRHLGAARQPERVRTLRMAVRLARRLTQPPAPPPADLAQAAQAFAEDGAWVDAARDALADGETVSSLAGAYGRLAAAVDGERRQRDLAFAVAFAGWSAVQPTTSHPLLPIERVLDEVVAPLARLEPVLLLILDGLSHPEATRLFADIAAAGWAPRTPAGRRLPQVVAAVPTVTAVSRTSLLCGRLTDGDQQTERTGFADHTGLQPPGAAPPALFHKRDLGVEQGRIAPVVHHAILDTGVRVVGVVVNGVDDHLAKGGQLRLAEGLAGVKPLRMLLEAATEAGRVIILTSDHGHVREHGTTVRPAPGGGERWRCADAAPRDDEVVIAGPRVLRGGGRIVAPATEDVRYIPTEKYGYHGGASPQEVLCPLAVFAPSTAKLQGWQLQPLLQPAWWDSRGVVTHLPDLPEAPKPEPALDTAGQPMLFATPDTDAPSRAPARSGWVADLLSSPVLTQQRVLAGRAALDDHDVARFLRLLDAADGVAPGPALMRATNLGASRLRSKLEALRRMLNVDGYPVLTLEPDGTARLNRSLLATQFGIQPW